MCFLFFILTFFVICDFANGFEHFLTSVRGDVKRGNFSYFSVSYDGTVLIELTSVSGDCDLYVSQKTNKPTYEPESYCLQSATCGLDSVIVPKNFNRPIGIGVFGHPSHDVCSYQLVFFRVADNRDIFNYDPNSKTLQTLMSKAQSDRIHSDAAEEEESFFWIFLRSLIVVLIECIL